MPARGRREALRLLIDSGKQTHDFLEPSGREEGLRQGIYGSPHLGIGNAEATPSARGSRSSRLVSGEKIRNPESWLDGFWSATSATNRRRMR